MNKAGNQRKQETKEKIHQALFSLMKEKEIHKITVSDICAKAQIHRTTFYGHYLDVLDLTDHIVEEMNEEMLDLFDGTKSTIMDGGFENLFLFVKEHQEYFRLYFALRHQIGFQNLSKELQGNLNAVIHRLEYQDEQEVVYHQAFFAAGLSAIIQKWVDGGCKETVSYMTNVIVHEYADHKGNRIK